MAEPSWGPGIRRAEEVLVAFAAAVVVDLRTCLGAGKEGTCRTAACRGSPAAARCTVGGIQRPRTLSVEDKPPPQGLVGLLQQREDERTWAVGSTLAAALERQDGVVRQQRQLDAVGEPGAVLGGRGAVQDEPGGQDKPQQLDEPDGLVEPHAQGEPDGLVEPGGQDKPQQQGLVEPGAALDGPGELGVEAAEVVVQDSGMQPLALFALPSSLLPV